MKTITALTLATAGIVGSANAFSLDFAAFATGTPLNNSIVVPVPGYGDVRFTEAATPVSELEITEFFGGIFKGINFTNGEQVFVTFEAGPVTDVEFAFAGVEADENFTQDVLDYLYLDMELTLPHEDGQTCAKVTKRVRDANCLPIVTTNDNPLLDSKVYEVE